MLTILFLKSIPAKENLLFLCIYISVKRVGTEHNLVYSLCHVYLLYLVIQNSFFFLFQRRKCISLYDFVLYPFFFIWILPFTCNHDLGRADKNYLLCNSHVFSNACERTFIEATDFLIIS